MENRLAAADNRAVDVPIQGDPVIATDTATRATARPRSAQPRTGWRDDHIVAILPRGEAIRNFVYSNALDRVAERAKLTVLSVIPNDEILHLLETRYGRVYELPNIPERWAVGAVRELLDVAHGRWLWSEVAKSRWEIRDHEARTPAARVKRGAKKALATSFASRRGLRLLSSIERTSARWLRTNQDLAALFRELKPTLVFNASHVHSAISVQAMQAAQWLGIRTATFLFSWDNLTSQGRIVPPCDHYLVWNDRIGRDLLHIYKGTIKPEQVSVTGTPQFDFHFRPEFAWSRREFCAHVGAEPNRPIVLYTTGMANPMFGEPRIVEGIAQMLRAMPEPRPQLLVRVYPKDRTGRFDDVKQRNPDVLFPPVPWEPSWLTPMPGDIPLLTNTLRHADVGINAASTVSLELCMFNKPVVNVGYNPPGMDIRPWDYARFYRFDHYRPVVESGAVKVAGSEAEMAAMIADGLAAPTQGSQERQALVDRMFGTTLDGRCGERVADRLIQLAAVGARA
jgi:hypothetical protein